VAKCCSNQGLNDVVIHAHDKERNVVPISDSLFMVLPVAKCCNNQGLSHVDIISDSVWSDLWQSAAAIRVSATWMYLLMMKRGTWYLR
jgi:hypothetical protein